MPLATAFNPDGSPVCAADGTPLTYLRDTEDRAFRSALRSWWPVGKLAKHGIGPEWGQAPEGAEIRMEGRAWKRFELVPVLNDAGETVDAKPEWVDIQARAAADNKAARLARLREQHTKRQIEHGVLPPEVALLQPGESVTGGGGTTGPATFTDAEGRVISQPSGGGGNSTSAKARR